VFGQKKETSDKNSNDNGAAADDGAEAEGLNRITHAKEPTLSEKNEVGFLNLIKTFQRILDTSKNNNNNGATKNDSSNANTTSSSTSSILDIAKTFNSTVHDTSRGIDRNQEIEDFWNLIRQCRDQWSTVLAQDSKVKDVSPVAFMYFVGFEESRKTPSYRRREHRFYPAFEAEGLPDLHAALYLATISYMHKVEDISDALNDFKGSPWVMVYCEVTSRPHEPGHYICIKKEQEKVEGGGGFRWPWQEDKILDVLLVVRGTKEIADVLSDALIEKVPYGDGGMAHGGIQKSGSYLVKKHTPFLETLLKESGRDKIRLSILGHSLGAGAGAIAAMEWNKKEWIEANAIGFGCPPVLSKDLSESTKDFITTVVCDSDVVPRMSGATISNVVNDVMSRSYKDLAVIDVHQVLDAIAAKAPFKPPEEQKHVVVKYIERALDDDFEKYRVVNRSLVEVVLFPPGKCIHLYDDGPSYSAAYVPCTFFDKIDVTRTMIKDHTTAGGYSRVFHEMMRNHLDDCCFTFPHSVEGVNKKCG
jgi:hypothetical protein